MSVENQPSETPTPKASGIGSFIKKLLVALLIVIAIFAGIVAAQPDEFVVSRSTTLDAPPAKVFPHINDFHKWEEWSPWAKLDPAAKNTFEGPDEGKGAIFSWDGNEKVGAGRMTILESKPDELINMKLEFFRPMEDVSTTDFLFKPEGDKTALTWKMSGKHTSFIGKAICFVMNMDKIVGGQFEEGLNNLKKAVAADKS